jgi:nitroimidazol reductase NimA-like FMN-containing flavoprotein (pyridoxamine 5'-phosphate oxidase superfamily)
MTARVRARAVSGLARRKVALPMQNTMPSGAQEILAGRFIASLGTQNEDGSVHLTAVWYLSEGGCFYVATSSRSRKARNVLSRRQASLMVDVRKPASERGLVAICTVDVVEGENSREINARIRRRYMSEAALADPRAGGMMSAMDDITLRLTPTNWYEWDMRVLDDALFGGAMKTPGYLLPLD